MKKIKQKLGFLEPFKIGERNENFIPERIQPNNLFHALIEKCRACVQKEQEEKITNLKKKIQKTDEEIH